MPSSLLSRPTTDTVRVRSPSLFTTPATSNTHHPSHRTYALRTKRVPTPAGATIVSPGAGTLESGKNSVAMRSVRSLTRIGSWAQLRNAQTTEDTDKKDKNQPYAKKKKKKKDRDKEKAKETIRYSGSSFEAGALTASPAGSKINSKSLGKQKSSILGLGLPSTMCLPSLPYNGSTALSAVVTNGFGNAYLLIRPPF